MSQILKENPVAIGSSLKVHKDNGLLHHPCPLQKTNKLSDSWPLNWGFQNGPLRTKLMKGILSLYKKLQKLST